IWSDASPGIFRDKGTFLARPEDVLIMASVNCFRKGIFKLKQLCDVAETVNTLGEIQWDIVAERADKFKSAAIVYAVVFGASGTLGTSREIPLEAFAINPLK